MVEPLIEHLSDFIFNSETWNTWSAWSKLPELEAPTSDCGMPLAAELLPACEEAVVLGVVLEPEGLLALAELEGVGAPALLAALAACQSPRSLTSCPT